MMFASGMRSTRASIQASRRCPTTRRASQPTARISTRVATMPIVAWTESALIQPREPGARAAVWPDSGPSQARLMPDSRTNTNFTTRQVSQMGSKVSRPVRNRRCRRCARDGVGDIGGSYRAVAAAAMRAGRSRRAGEARQLSSELAHQAEADVVVAASGIEHACGVFAAPAGAAGPVLRAVGAAVGAPLRQCAPARRRQLRDLARGRQAIAMAVAPAQPLRIG